MTQEQNEQIFEIICKKAGDEWAAAARKFKLQLELTINYGQYRGCFWNACLVPNICKVKIYPQN